MTYSPVFISSLVGQIIEKLDKEHKHDKHLFLKKCSEIYKFELCTNDTGFLGILRYESTKYKYVEKLDFSIEATLNNLGLEK